MLKKTILLTLTICAAASFPISQPAYAQISEFKITASDGAGGGWFGNSVSISGDYAIVGAWGDDDNGNDAGSAYVFKRSDTSWVQELKLLPSDGAAENHFGYSVSISGDYAVLGAICDSDNGSCSGSAYLFKRSDTSWAQEAKILPSDGAADDWFGWSVSISGDYAVVGAYQDDDNGDLSGSAYLFKRTGTSWAQEAKILPSDGAADDRFGGSVSISGDYTVVGAYGDDNNGSSSGSAYLYTGFATAVGVESEEVGIPAEFSLSQNYPNPFNPMTTIHYDLPKQSHVTLTIYDLLGRQVKMLVNQTQDAGFKSIQWDASSVPSGIYFYQISAGSLGNARQKEGLSAEQAGRQAGDFIRTRKMAVLK